MRYILLKLMNITVLWRSCSTADRIIERCKLHWREDAGKERVLERKGTTIGPMDMLIAAHARAEGLILVTNNTREFERVEELELEDWTME